MKPGRSLLVVTLTALLALLFSQAAPAQLLKSTSQILTIGASTEDGMFDYSGAEKLWRQMPNGTQQEFTFTTKQTLLMTGLSVRFFPLDPVAYPGPYRLYFTPVHDPFNPPTPPPAKFCIVMLDNINDSGVIVGGSKTIDYNPGVHMTVRPMVFARQLPPAPNNPNSGPVVPGKIYFTIYGIMP